MNKTIRRASAFCLLMVLALLVRATWVQGYEAKALADDEHNRRNTIAQYAQPLGDIIVAGSPVTGSKETRGDDLRYKRTYDDGGLYASVTGYSSQAYGATQLEGIYSHVLDGTDDRLKNPTDLITGKQTSPGDVVTTIDPAVQKAAAKALGDDRGAAVAMDPETGRILGMVSSPSYDPSDISGTSDGDAWQKLLADKDKPLVNRALRQPLAPGSTFKLVVAAAALENGLYDSVDRPTDSPNPYTLPGTSTVLRNESASAPCENATLRTALQYSCNNVFAKAAADLGQDKVKAMADAFGFDTEKLDVPVRAAQSVYPAGMDKAQTALTGIGQFEVTATPMQMAMVSAALADGGELAAPHMVSKVTDSDGSTGRQVRGGGRGGLGFGPLRGQRQRPGRPDRAEDDEGGPEGLIPAAASGPSRPSTGSCSPRGRRAGEHGLPVRGVRPGGQVQDGHERRRSAYVSKRPGVARPSRAACCRRVRRCTLSASAGAALVSESNARAEFRASCSPPGPDSP